MLNLMHPSMWLVLLATRTHCWLIFNLPLTQTTYLFMQGFFKPLISPSVPAMRIIPSQMENLALALAKFHTFGDCWALWSIQISFQDPWGRESTAPSWHGWYVHFSFFIIILEGWLIIIILWAQILKGKQCVIHAMSLGSRHTSQYLILCQIFFWLPGTRKHFCLSWCPCYHLASPPELHAERQQLNKGNVDLYGTFIFTRGSRLRQRTLHCLNFWQRYRSLLFLTEITVMSCSKELCCTDFGIPLLPFCPSPPAFRNHTVLCRGQNGFLTVCPFYYFNTEQ